MTLEFTPEGLSIETLDEAYERLAQGYREIYGNDIDLAQDSPDGQRVGIEAKLLADLQAFALSLYNSFDPDLAQRNRLDSIIKICGINRRPATRSSWDIEVVTTRPVTLQQDYTIEDSLGQQWFVPEELDLPSGTTTVTFRAVEFGAVSGSAGEEFSQVTVTLGVSSFNAAGDAVVGVAEETDVQLRQRRNRSIQNPSYSTTGGLFSRLADTAGVTDVQVYENDTDNYDAVRNIAAHTLWCIVEGGTVADIAETIAKNKTGGTGLKGSQSGTYQESLLRPDGTELISTIEIQFDRPSTTQLYLNVTAEKKDPEDTLDVQLIKEKLAELIFRIGEEAVASEFYDAGYEAGDNFFLRDLQISDDNLTFTDGRLLAALDSKFSLEVANVTVTEV